MRGKRERSTELLLSCNPSNGEKERYRKECHEKRGDPKTNSAHVVVVERAFTFLLRNRGDREPFLHNRPELLEIKTVDNRA